MEKLKNLVMIVVMFFVIFIEMGRQMLMMTLMDADEFEVLQDKKLSDERQLGLDAEKDKEIIDAGDVPIETTIGDISYVFADESQLGLDTEKEKSQ